MISVVICTYNRCEDLKRTLISIDNQKVSNELTAEIIVVDNNSKDNTKNVVSTCEKSSRWPLRYVLETQQGAAHARNAGIRSAQGDIIAYLDDDAVADANWLEGIANSFKKNNADVVGGKIVARWECDKPGWYSDEIKGPVIAQDFGPGPVQLTRPDSWMLTANVAFKKDVFTRCGLFNGDLGRRGDTLVGGEEPEIFKRLHAAGLRIFYEPAAVVFHGVEEKRLKKDFLRRWFYDTGRTIGHLMEWKWFHYLMVMPLWEWKEFLKASLKFLVESSKFRAKESKRFAAEVWMRHHWGVLVERFLHWLPFRMGLQACVFERQV